MQRLYVTCEKSVNYLKYNFFQELVCIIGIAAGAINFTQKHCCATLIIFIQLTVTCTSTTTTHRMRCCVSTAKWIRERAKMLGYTRNTHFCLLDILQCFQYIINSREKMTYQDILKWKLFPWRCKVITLCMLISAPDVGEGSSSLNICFIFRIIIPVHTGQEVVCAPGPAWMLPLLVFEAWFPGHLRRYLYWPRNFFN
jgi:hypothetical protein